MYHFSTKSIQESKGPDDGLRVCIMRRIKPEFDFDLWLPNLSPSTELLQKYQEEGLSWEDFREQFLREIEDKDKYFDLLGHLIKFSNVTLLCWEETSELCHRKIVGEILEERSHTKVNFQ